MELPKLPKELKEDSSDIELWGRFISAERKEDFAMLAEKNMYIGSTYQHLQVISQDEEKRLEYEVRAKAIRDYNQVMLEAEQRGRVEGEAIGETRGMEQGMERVNKLNILLINDKRYQDLERSVNDAAFQKKLMSEYRI